MIDRDVPAAQVAAMFLRHKGYDDIEPADIHKLDDIDCWYFFYRLPDGDLELEVSFNGSTQEWETLVTGFKVAV